MQTESHSLHPRSAHPLNAPGDFYVEDGCCLSCDMPFQEAPGHFEYDADGHCYVCKQPSNFEEAERMAHAVNVSEASCIRYAGQHPAVLAKLAALNEQSQCDALERRSTAPTTRATAKRVWWMFWRR